MRGMGESSPLLNKHRGGAADYPVYKSEVSSRAKNQKDLAPVCVGYPPAHPSFGWGGAGEAGKSKLRGESSLCFPWNFLARGTNR